MKFLTTLFLLALTFIDCAGYENITDKERYFEYIGEHPLNQEEAFDASMEWVAKSFVSANTVIQLQNKEQGKIILQAVGSYYYDILNTHLVSYRYTLSITIRDNKSKYEFTVQNTIESGLPPQKKDMPNIEKNFLVTKNNITAYLSNYTKDNF